MLKCNVCSIELSYTNELPVTSELSGLCLNCCDAVDAIQVWSLSAGFQHGDRLLQVAQSDTARLKRLAIAAAELGVSQPPAS